MGATDDMPELFRVAGVALERPRARYDLSGPVFGRVAAERGRVGRGVMLDLVLDLNPDVAEVCAARGGTPSQTVRMPMLEWARLVGAGGDETPAADLRDALVVHHLLSRPGLVGVGASSGPSVPPTSEAVRTLAARAHALTRSTATRVALACEGCKALRGKGAQASQRECPHAVMFHEAGRTLCKTFPELVFELLGLIEPAREGTARFVLAPKALASIVARWALGRERIQRDENYYYRWQRRADVDPRAWTSLRHRAREAVELPAEHRAAVAWSANAWGYDDKPAALAWRPDDDALAATALPTLGRVADDDALDVAVLAPTPVEAPVEAPVDVAAEVAAEVPARVAAEAPVEARAKVAELEVVPEVPAKPAAKEKPAVKEKPVAKSKAKPAFKTREVLASIGIPASILREMVRDGQLVKVGPGQYVTPAEARKMKKK